MKKQYIVLVTAAFISVISLTWLQFKADSQSDNVEANEDSSGNSIVEQSIDTPKHVHSVPSESVLPYKSELGNLPSTLKGTEMHQALAVDEQGHLRVSSDIKRVFDFFLSAIEEEELETVLARIEEYLEYHLEEPALAESKQVLNEYITLKTALFEFETERSESLKSLIESGELLQDKDLYLKLLREQLEARNALRAEHLSPDVYESFYASEEAYDEYTLARMLVESNATLSDEEKQLRLAEIDQNAPSDIVESRKEAQITDTLRARTEAIIQSGGSQEDIDALRTEMFGYEAAERFSQLDQERAEWKSRLDAYLSQRRLILENEGLSVDEQTSQVTALKESMFDQREQIRVQVYERKSDQEAAKS